VCFCVPIGGVAIELAACGLNLAREGLTTAKMLKN